MDEEQVQNFSFLQFRDKLTQYKKKVLAFVGLLVLACILLGSCFFVAGYTLAKIIMLAGFLGLGYKHLANMQGGMDLFSQKEKLAYSIFLALLIVIVLAIFEIITHRFYFFTVLACGAVFLLAYCINGLWQLFVNATEKQPSLWYFSNDLPLHQGTVFLNSLPIKVKVQIEQQGRVEYLLAFRAPVKMKLGLVFYHMIQEQNKNGRETIEFQDRNGKPYGWAFFTRTIFGWHRYLNPEDSLVENGIIKDKTIIVRRVTDQSLMNSPVWENQISKTVV